MIRPIPDGALLLYDGTCGLCARAVQFVLRHERTRRTLRFATLQGRGGERARRAHPWLADVDSIALLVPSPAGGVASVLVRSDAALAIAAYLGGPWRLLAAVGGLIPRVLRDAAYDLIARHRRRIAPMNDTCLTPTREERRRFVDDGRARAPR